MKKSRETAIKITTILVPLALLVPVSAYFIHDTGGVTASESLGAISTVIVRNKVHINPNNFANQPLNPKVLNQAMKAYRWAILTGKVHNKKVLTIVDFSLGSNKKRLWVINPLTGKVLLNLHTSQGKNSGLKYATHFSNTPNSKASSLGAYVTSITYEGKHGESMRLQGLEKGINNNAMRRDIVIHPANYVTPGFLKAEGRLGRSWGCFAVNPHKSKELISLTKGGSVLFAYAPSENHDPNFG